ncbi:MAG TPA: GNAT family N-acetyltransferase [Candidatus Acidoferrum sp.]|nr:GNAT family N-acetyltransferase [Candidatus Acidoferrum sp.]
MRYLIKSKNLNLRTLRESDAKSLAKYAKDRAVSRGTFIPHPFKLSDATTIIRRSRNLARRKEQKTIVLGIEYKQTGEIIGGVGLHQINYRMKNTEVGCWIGKPFRGTGLMVEAMYAVLRYAFNELKLKRVHAHIYVENIASQKMVEKCGFVREARVRCGHLHHKRWKNSYLYSILREDLRK